VLQLLLSPRHPAEEENDRRRGEFAKAASLH
jgi:hypothetical protein